MRDKSCDSMVWGSMSRELKLHDLLPLSEGPHYDANSVGGIRRRIHFLKLETLCQYTHGNRKCCRGFYETLKEDIDAIWTSQGPEHFRALLEEL